MGRAESPQAVSTLTRLKEQHPWNHRTEFPAYKVADISLAEWGRKEIGWPRTRCPA